MMSHNDGHFEVIDIEGRNWGSVTLKNESDRECYGYLHASDSFDDVREIFRLHEKLMSERGTMEDSVLVKNTQEIFDLKVSLKCINSNQEFSAGIAFVSETKNGLLFSCEKLQRN